MGMSQNFLVNCFKWVEETSQFNEDFKESYNKERDEGCFLEVDVQYPEKLHELHKYLPLQGIIKIEKVEKLVVNLHDKREHVIQIIKIINMLLRSWISFEKGA